jgi:hypothetical protein
MFGNNRYIQTRTHPRSLKQVMANVLRSIFLVSYNRISSEFLRLFWCLGLSTIVTASGPAFAQHVVQKEPVQIGDLIVQFPPSFKVGIERGPRTYEP